MDFCFDLFWDATTSIKTRLKQNKFSQIKRFADLLSKAVNSHLVADVPVGTFNSGGIDSSLISLVAAQSKQDRLNTFSIHQPNTPFNESTQYAI